MSRSETSLLRIVRHIYQTIEEPVMWPAVLAEISDILHGGVAALLYHDLRAHHGALNHSVRLAPEAIDAYQQHFHLLDPWAKGTASLGLGRTGAVLNGDQLIALSDLRRTEYYGDYASRYDLVRILAGVVIADGPVLSVISILRAEKARAFGQNEQQQLAILMGHLKCVLEIRRRIESLRLLQAASSHALDRLPTGVILVDATGRIVFANNTADRLLKSQSGLSVRDGRLTAVLAGESAALRSLITAAIATTTGRALNSGGVMTVSRPHSARPLSVLVTPIAEGASYANLGHAGAAVLMSDPDHATVPDSAVLRAVFGLTATECRLVIAICSGLSLAEAAQSLRLTRETAKTYLKHVFLKTGTSRQAELVAVVSRLTGLNSGTV